MYNVSTMKYGYTPLFCRHHTYYIILYTILHWVISTLGPRMATADTPDSTVSASEDTIFLDCLVAVLRTVGLKRAETLWVICAKPTRIRG